jgi:hypothetical protein
MKLKINLTKTSITFFLNNIQIDNNFEYIEIDNILCKIRIKTNVIKITKKLKIMKKNQNSKTQFHQF